MIGGKRWRNARSSHGLTLLELVVVMALLGSLASVASWGGRQLLRGWQLKRAGHQLLEDLKAVQGRAEMSGSMTLSNGALVAQQSFLVFDPGAQRYAAYAWRDRNGDHLAQAGESEQLWQKDLPPGVFFGWGTGIDRRACSNVTGPPTRAISFSSPNSAPCAGRPCIKFDQHGFSIMGPGAVYLSEGEQTLAVSGTRPGHFTICNWSGERWR